MYKLIAHGITRLQDGASIPIDTGNRDYQEYLAWVKAGNTPQPMDPPPPPTQDALDAEAARQYAKLTALRAMRPAEVMAWVENNINTLAQAKDAIKTLAVAVGVLARRI